MAISLDGSTNDYQTGVNDGDTFSHTTTAGSDLALILVLSTFDAGGTKITEIEYNSVAMTLEYEFVDTAGTFAIQQIWSLVAPDTGANTVNYKTLADIGAISDVVATAYSFSGVDQTTPIDVTANNTTATSPTVDITTSNANSWIVAAMLSEQSTGTKVSVDSPATERHKVDTGTETLGISDRSVTTATTYTMSWTDTDDDEETAMIAGEVKEAAAGDDHTLAPNDLALTLTADATTITQDHVLATTDMALSLTSDSTTISQNHVLSTDDMDLSLTADATTIALNYTLDPADLALSLTADATTIEQDHVLSPDDLAITLTSDNTAITQSHILASDDLAITLTADNTTVDTAIQLAPDDLALTLTADATTIAQDHVLAPADIDLTLTSDNTTITQDHVLASDDMLLGLGMDSTTLITVIYPGEYQDIIIIRQEAPKAIDVSETQTSVTASEVTDPGITVKGSVDFITVKETDSSV